MKKTKRVAKKPKLPPYVVLKFDPEQWHVRRVFPLGYRDAKNRIVYSQITRRCVPETSERAAEISDEIERQWKSAVPAEPVRHLGGFLTEFIDVKRQSVRARTHHDYQRLRERYIDGTAFAGLDPVAVTPLDVQRFYTELGARGVSAKMLRKVNTLISMAFTQAMRWGLRSTNPTHGVVLPRAAHTEIEIMTQAEARHFMKVCLTDDRFLILAFALETGMRPEEYLALRWSDLDLGKCLVRISRAVTFPRGGGFEFGDVKTQKSRRTVEITAVLRDRLLIHRDIQAEAVQRLRKRLTRPLKLWPWNIKGANYDKRKRSRRRTRDALRHLAEYDLVFPSLAGTPRSAGSVGRIEMKEVCKLAGVPPHSLYSLRHSMATLSLAAGADIKTISEKLGHASIRITLDTYAHVLPVMRSAVTAKIAEALY